MTVERELEGRDDGIIVTLDLLADISGPLRVDVRDDFPADLPAEQAGFNLEYEPDEGDLSLERAKIRHTIEDDEARIVYAIRLSEPVEPVEFGDPSIENVSLPGLTGPEPEDDEGDDPGVATEEPDQESVAFDASAFEPSAGADRTAGTAPDDVDGVDETGSAPDATGAQEAGSGGADDGTDAPDPGGEGTDDGWTATAEVGGVDDESIERAIAESERSSDDGPGEELGSPSNGEEPAGGTTVAGEDTADDGTVDPAGVGGRTDATASPDDPRVGGARGSGASSDRDGAATPGAEPDPTADDDASDRGRGENGSHDSASGVAPGGTPAASDANPAGDEMSRSVRLRLDRLNARVEEFATYAEALEDIIEREGTGPEIIENLESNLTDANERLEEVRADVDALQSEHSEDVSTVRDRIDALEAELEDARSDLRADVVEVRGTVDDVGADVERVDAETADNAADVEEVRNHLETVESAVHSLDERVDDYEDDIEGVSESVESVQSEVSELSESIEAMRSDLESVQVDVERLLRFREILADVFGGPVQRATEDGRGPTDLSEENDADDGGSISTPSEPSG